ncbi:hypothetical protein NJL88_04740 [Streptomyces sp. DK15]|nr:hypothetical protein [Streptomyces sp. DK15]
MSSTSVVNWTRRGMAPKAPVPSLIARALGERLGRPLDVAEIGMHPVRENADQTVSLHERGRFRRRSYGLPPVDGRTVSAYRSRPAPDARASSS